jgi:hypothetical protein
MINIDDPGALKRYLEIKEEKTRKEIIINLNILENKIKIPKDKLYCGHYESDIISIDHGSYHPRGGEYK